MDYVVGDLISLDVGHNGRYEYTIRVGVVKKGKRNLLSMETMLYELINNRYAKNTIGLFTKDEVDDLIKKYAGQVERQAPGDIGDLSVDLANWMF